MKLACQEVAKQHYCKNIRSVRVPLSFKQHAVKRALTECTHCMDRRHAGRLASMAHVAVKKLLRSSGMQVKRPQFN
jgi:hypothetical protein